MHPTPIPILLYRQQQLMDIRHLSQRLQDITRHLLPHRQSPTLHHLLQALLMSTALLTNLHTFQTTIPILMPTRLLQ